MGIFSKIFGKKSTFTTYHNLEISQLDSWLDTQSQELITKSKLDKELVHHIHNLQVKRSELEKNIQEWELALPALSHDQQEENRALLLQVKKLLSLLNFPESPNFKKAVEINVVFRKYFDMTIKKIEESRFAHDFSFLLKTDSKSEMLHPLTKNLMELDSIRSYFDQKISQSGYRNFDTLYRKSLLLRESHHKLNQLKHHLQEKKERLKFTLEKKEEKIQELSNLKQDQGYDSLQEIYAQRERLSERMEENNDHVFLFFSKIKPALQFYKHQHPNSWLIDLYLEDPAMALSHDENLEILPILQQLEEQLTQDSASLSPEDINIFLGHLNKVREGCIQVLQSDFYGLKNELNQIDLSLKSRYFIFKIQEAHYRVDHFTTQVEKINEEIAQLEDEISELQDFHTKEQQFFQNTAKISLNKEITLTFPIEETVVK
ncbi:hypothetical protein HYX11_01725 [Candidatus Woesearchaeota archaeon]|nr:hypothetical protein [Candidatus Woesearchaeota archaeon]